MMEILASGVSMAEGKVGEVRLMGIMANVMADGDWDDSDGDQWTCTAQYGCIRLRLVRSG